MSRQKAAPRDEGKLCQALNMTKEILHHGRNLSGNDLRKEVSMEPPQYDRGLSGLQKREYLARTKGDFFRNLL